LIKVTAPAAQFTALGKALKEAGDKDLNKNLRKEIRKVASPVVKQMRVGVKGLPGAPSEWRAEAARKTSAKAELKVAKRAGVRIVTMPSKGGKHRSRWMNRGMWRHPSWPRGEDRSAWKWVAQQVRKGWFDNPAKAAKPEVVIHVIKAMNDTAEKIARKGKA
jgi:hypothetical protein